MNHPTPSSSRPRQMQPVSGEYPRKLQGSRRNAAAPAASACAGRRNGRGARCCSPPWGGGTRTGASNMLSQGIDPLTRRENPSRTPLRTTVSHENVSKVVWTAA
eukprot:755815-Hanusia_phi.AAC.4